jgi:DNA-binding CsgD family transcriptional regulator
MGDCFLRSSRVTQLLRLFGEARERLNDPLRQQHLIAGLCRLVGAQVAAMVETEDFRPGGRGPVVDMVDHGWPSHADRMTVFGPMVVGGSAVDPALKRLMCKRGQVVTLRRQELVSDKIWYSDAMVMDHRRAARIDHAIYSMRSTGTIGKIYGLCLNRSWGERPFDEEDRELIRLFHEESVWLMAPSPIKAITAAIQGLSPRERQTLESMLTGASEKEIAAGLGISPHTVHHYIKSLYRRFGVQSRPELMARCWPLRQSGPRS